MMIKKYLTILNIQQTAYAVELNELRVGIIGLLSTMNVIGDTA